MQLGDGQQIYLTHWGSVTHICLNDLTIIGSDNSLSPGRRQAIIWTNAGISLIGLLRTNFSEILIEIHGFSFKKTHLKMSSAKWHPFCSASMCWLIDPERCSCSLKISIFQIHFKDRYFSISCEIALRWRPWSANTGSDNGLVSSGTKPLPVPMLTQIYVPMWRH